MELVEFELASGRYALPMDRVVELAPMVLARDLPGAPPTVTGMVNHRGSAIALVPLRRVFKLEGETLAERTDGRGPVDDHLVIAEGRTRRYALQVDRVTGAADPRRGEDRRRAALAARARGWWCSRGSWWWCRISTRSSP